MGPGPETLTTSEPKPRSWQFVLAVFCASSLLEVAAFGQLDAFIPLFLARDLGVPDDEVARWAGILAAAPMVLAVPLSPLWGVLSDRYNRKVIILRSQFIAAVAYGLAAVSQNTWQLLGVRLLLGLTFGSNAVITATVAGLVPERRIGLAIGMLQMMFPVARSVGPLLGSGLIALFGIRGMFAVDALLAFGAFSLVLILFEEPARQRDVSLGIRTRLAAVTGLVWRLPQLRMTFVLFALFAGGLWMIHPFLPVLIDRLYEGEDVAFVIGLILGGYGAVAAIAAPLSGRLSDLLGPTRLVIGSMVCLILLSAGLMIAQTPLQVGLVVLFGGIPYGATSTALYSYLARHTPREHLGAVMALTPMARNTSMLLGPLIGAAVVGFGLRSVFAAGVAVYAIGLASSLYMASLADRASAAQPSPEAHPRAD